MLHLCQKMHVQLRLSVHLSYYHVDYTTCSYTQLSDCRRFAASYYYVANRRRSRPRQLIDTMKLSISFAKLGQTCQSLGFIYVTLEFRVITIGFRAHNSDLFAGTVVFHIRFQDTPCLRCITTVTSFLLAPFNTTPINSQLTTKPNKVTEFGLSTKSKETKQKTLKLQTRSPRYWVQHSPPGRYSPQKCNGVYQAINKEKEREEVQVERYSSLGGCRRSCSSESLVHCTSENC